MKNYIFPKIKLVQTIFVLSIWFTTFSCENKPTTADATEVADEQNEKKFNTIPQEQDAEFLVTAAAINLEEINLGQLAQQNSMMPDVKAMGEMMENLHNKSLDEISAMALKRQITLPIKPSDDANKIHQKLRDKSGKAFDKEYSNLMVSNHEAAIETFEKVSAETKDPEIKEWVVATIPLLRTHLDEAIICQKKYDKM